jgi:hypothetical protein
VPFCPPRFSHEATRDWTRDPAEETPATIHLRKQTKVYTKYIFSKILRPKGNFHRKSAVSLLCGNTQREIKLPLSFRFTRSVRCNSWVQNAELSIFSAESSIVGRDFVWNTPRLASSKAYQVHAVKFQKVYISPVQRGARDIFFWRPP